MRGATCLVLGSVVRVVRRVFYLFRVPLRQGGSSYFYRPRKERITCSPRYLAT
jgi:hypothetical protein